MIPKIEREGLFKGLHLNISFRAKDEIRQGGSAIDCYYWTHIALGPQTGATSQEIWDHH